MNDSRTRTALLDVAEKLMLEEGYAAVTSRRVATEAGVNASLVYYYFDTMDGLFIELFRRGAGRSFARQARVLSSAQPLWGLWEATQDQSNSALTAEFIALANHRKEIRTEISEYGKKFRRLQLEVMSSVLEDYGLDVDRWPPATIILLLDGIARYLQIEEAFHIDIGHADMVTVIERHIRQLEGERRAVHPALADLHD